MPICSHRLLLFSIHVSCVLCVDTHNSGSISRALYESVPHRPTHRPVFYLLLPNLFLFSPRNDDDDDDVPPPPLSSGALAHKTWKGIYLSMADNHK